MKKSVVFTSLLILFISQVNAQNSKSIGLSVGLLQLGGQAFGGSIFFENAIDCNLEFTFSVGAYSWNYGRDLNTHAYIEPAETHVSELMKWMIPIRAGIKYNFGKNPSHPYASLEWGINYFGEELQFPRVLTPDNPNHLIIYNIEKQNLLYASLGMTMGYTFNLSKDWNLDLGIVTHTGSNHQYVNFISAIKYSI